MTIFPTGYTNKGFADATDKVWASDGVTNFNITVNEIGTEVFADRTTSNLSEGTNLYYTDGRVSANSTIVALGINKANKTNVLEKDNVTAYSPTTQYHPATKGYVDNLGTNITGLTTEDNITDSDEQIYYDASISANRKTTFLNYSEKIRVKNQRHQIITGAFELEDVAQSNITISHSLGVTPRSIEIIFVERLAGSGVTVLDETIKGVWSNNNGTITSVATSITDGTRLISTANQDMLVLNIGSGIGRWKVDSTSTTNVVFSYSFTDAGTLYNFQYNVYFKISA